jgi:hypothetical protein
MFRPSPLVLWTLKQLTSPYKRAVTPSPTGSSPDPSETHLFLGQVLTGPPPDPSPDPYRTSSAAKNHENIPFYIIPEFCGIKIFWELIPMILRLYSDSANP